MRHAKFYEQNPNAPYSVFDKYSRQELNEMYMTPWKQFRSVAGDPLAFRAYLLRREGWQTLHNVIRGAHGLPNRY